MTRNHIILLVEDNPDDVELTLRAFEKSNVANEIIVARDGAEALEHFFSTGEHGEQDHRPMPEVVLLDLKLPKIDGLEVLSRLRADDRTRRLPIVMLTSSNEEKDVVRSYERGANSFVRKPVDFGEFVRLAQRLGLYWLALNEPPPGEPTVDTSRLKGESLTHELRAPLNSIIGFAELMHKGTVGPVSAEHREYLGEILNNAKRLLQLINDTSALAKIESGTSSGPITHKGRYRG